MSATQNKKRSRNEQQKTTKRYKNKGDITVLPYEIWLEILQFIGKESLEALFFPEKRKSDVINSSPISVQLGKYLSTMFLTYMFYMDYVYICMEETSKDTLKRINMRRLVRTLFTLLDITFYKLEVLCIDTPYMMKILLQNNHKFPKLKYVKFLDLTAKSFESPLTTKGKKITMRIEKKIKELKKIFTNVPSIEFVIERNNYDNKIFIK